MRALPFPLNIIIDGPAGVIAGLGAHALGLVMLVLAIVAGFKVYGFVLDRLAPEAGRPPELVRWVAIGAGALAGVYVALVLFRALQTANIGLARALLD